MGLFLYGFFIGCVCEMNSQKTVGRGGTTYVYEDQKSVPHGIILYH